MRSSRYPEAAFLAVMTASATHEVRNVLAIIKESAGLIQDLAEMAKGRGAPDEEKVRRAVDRIETQVKRGADLLTSLSRLAHTLDEDRATVDLEEELGQMVFLTQRFARRKNQQVEGGPPGEGTGIATEPIRLHMGLFSAIECCLSELPQGARLVAGVREIPDGLAVEFWSTSEDGGTPEVTADPDRWEDLQRISGALGATAERLESGYGIRLLFREDPGSP
jgi:signal transduction histidine kinase